MFGRRRERRRVERRAAVIARCREADAEERARIADELLSEQDRDLGLYVLLELLDVELVPRARAELVETLTITLRNARPRLAEVEAALREGAGSPRRLVDSWTTWRTAVAERMGEEYSRPRWPDLDGLYEDLGLLQVRLTQADITPPPSLNSAPPEPPPVSEVAESIGELTAILGRHTYVPGWDPEVRRREVRDVLDRAQACPAGSEERAAALLQLLPEHAEPDREPRWTDQRDFDTAIDEVLRRHTAGEAEFTVDALGVLVRAPHHGRLEGIRTLLDALIASPDTEPRVLVRMLSAYEELALADRLVDLPCERMFRYLQHRDAEVRFAVTDLLVHLPGDAAEEAATVAELTRVLADDPDEEVRGNAAHALTVLRPTDEAQARAIARTLGDHACDPVPEVRVAYLRYVLERHVDSALPELIEELTHPDVSAAHVRLLSALDCSASGCSEADWWDHVEHYMHASTIFDQLSALADAGWPDLPERPYDPKWRAEILADATTTLRYALGEPI